MNKEQQEEVEKLIKQCREQLKPVTCYEDCEDNADMRSSYMTRILEVTSDHREMKMTTIEISINGHELSSDDVSKLVGDINKMEY